MTVGWEVLKEEVPILTHPHPKVLHIKDVNIFRDYMLNGAFGIYT